MHWWMFTPWCTCWKNLHQIICWQFNGWGFSVCGHWEEMFVGHGLQDSPTRHESLVPMSHKHLPVTSIWLVDRVLHFISNSRTLFTRGNIVALRAGMKWGSQCLSSACILWWRQPGRAGDALWLFCVFVHSSGSPKYAVPALNSLPELPERGTCSTLTFSSPSSTSAQYYSMLIQDDLIEHSSASQF